MIHIKLYLVLATHIPDCKADILIFDSLHIKSWKAEMQDQLKGERSGMLMI